ncbi:hypothetical protein ACJJTC_014766 [Scirpophaga incertulas]
MHNGCRLLLSHLASWLLVCLKDEQEARIALTKITRHSLAEHLNDEINDMRGSAKTTAAKQEQEAFSILDLFAHWLFGRKRSMVIAVIVMRTSHSSSALARPKRQENGEAQIQDVFPVNRGLGSFLGFKPGSGVVLFVMALVSIPLIDRLGRRTLQLCGLGGMMGFSILMTVAFFTYENNTTMSIFAVIFTFLYVGFFGVGPSSIPWMILSELFGQGARSAAVSVGALVNWFANFVVGLTFIPLSDALGNYVFLPYTVLLFLFFIFTYFKLPETKNKTIEEVTALFK